MHTFSVFDPGQHQEDVPSKIVVALEKIAEIFRVLLWNEAKVVNLSPLQIQILIFIQYHNPEKSRVTHLAQEFNLTKPTISDAIRVLLAKGLIERKQNEHDKRTFFYLPTSAGKTLSDKLSLFANPLRQLIADWDEAQQISLYTHLIQLIKQSQTQNLINMQRMCFNCSFYQAKEGQHYCHFVNSYLHDTQLRIDCQDFQLLEDSP